MLLIELSSIVQFGSSLGVWQGPDHVYRLCVAAYATQPTTSGFGSLHIYSWLQTGGPGLMVWELEHVLTPPAGREYTSVVYTLSETTHNATGGELLPSPVVAGLLPGVASPASLQLYTPTGADCVVVSMKLMFAVCMGLY